MDQDQESGFGWLWYPTNLTKLSDRQQRECQMKLPLKWLEKMMSSASERKRVFLRRGDNYFKRGDYKWSVEFTYIQYDWWEKTGVWRSKIPIKWSWKVWQVRVWQACVRRRDVSDSLKFPRAMVAILSIKYLHFKLLISQLITISCTQNLKVTVRKRNPTFWKSQGSSYKSVTKTKK